MCLLTVFVEKQQDGQARAACLDASEPHRKKTHESARNRSEKKEFEQLVSEQSNIAQGEVEQLLEKVELIDIDGTKITCTDLYGKSLTFTGYVDRIDAARSQAFIVLQKSRKEKS